MSAAFQVVINKLVGSSNGDGFIEPKRQDQYASLPTSLALSKAKVRGHHRYVWMLENLRRIANVDITALTSDATASGDATAISFTATFPHGSTYLRHDGELLSGAAAVKRAIAISMLINRSLLSDIVDPTTSAADSDAASSTQGVRRGYVAETLTVGALAASIAAAEAAITVTPA